MTRYVHRGRGADDPTGRTNERVWPHTGAGDLTRHTAAIHSEPSIRMQ